MRRMLVVTTMAGCVAATAPARADQTVVPAVLSTAPAAVIVPVTISGKQVAMKLDTGADVTVIDARAAKTLRLQSAGKAQSVQQLGCTVKSQPVSVSGWTLGDAQLPPLVAEASSSKGKISKVGGRPLVGLLGNDALGAFGTVGVDFVDGRVLLSPAFPDTGVSFPTKIRRPQSGTGVGQFVAPVRFGSKTVAMAIDTGAPVSTIEASAARKIKARKVGGPTPLRSPGCTTKTQRVRLKHWGTAKVPFAPEVVNTTRSAIAKTGILGLVGADQLLRYGQATFDYSSGTVALGYPVPPAPSGGSIAPTPTPTPSETIGPG